MSRETACVATSSATGREIRQVLTSSPEVAALCHQFHIRSLAFFGSILRDEFSLVSDVDILVEFETGKTPGLLGLAAIEQNLSRLVGRRVDLNTPGCLSTHFREEVLREMQQFYGET